ncbi:MAG: alpha-L-fucosidase, partial [Oscillospiraceae bacterium]|nr:alpha-L-fucosidase [Oscillospiraceae bacterium]
MAEHILSKPEYEAQTAATRDERMGWWREARFGMFVHYGLYALAGRNEWLQTLENIPIPEYEQFANQFRPKPGAPREWAALAKKAGMKYMVLTTRHHDGFSLWDSKANPYNSVNCGPGRDIVREYVDACREYDLKIGFYTSLMDWHHPDGGRAAQDPAARRRFLDYIEALNTELLTQYGRIDILWYDVAAPMQHHEGWDSVARNQRLRALQPHIIINNRSRLDEDFGTPEGRVEAEDTDWEACMTFNDISWGYIDEKQAQPYAYNAQRIIRMLNTCAMGGGNLLLNIGPAPDGSVPRDAAEPLEKTGQWLRENGG